MALKGEDIAAPVVARLFEPEFKLGARLIQFAQVMLPQPIEYEGDNGHAVVTSVLALMAMGLKVFRGIHYLSGNCLTEPALMLLRPLSEVLAGVGYIASDPSKAGERAEMYLAGEVTEHYRWVRKLVDDGATAHLPPDIVEDPDAILETVRHRLIELETLTGGVEGAAARVEVRLKRMIERSGWADVATEKMLEEAQAKLAYPLVFRWAAGVLHARKPSLFADIEEESGAIVLKTGVDPTHLGYALGVGNLLFAAILKAIDALFSLGRSKSIDGLLSEIDAQAKQRRVQGNPFGLGDGLQRLPG